MSTIYYPNNGNDDSRIVDYEACNGSHKYVREKYPELYKQRSRDRRHAGKKPSQLFDAFTAGFEHAWDYFEEHGYQPRKNPYLNK